MAQIKRTEARLRQIKQRQWVQKFGQHYVAATFSDAKEAPGISTGTTLRPTKLGQREFHTLSEPETLIALLALHNPACWDVHEQFVLFPKAREHPLQNHPLAAGRRFPPFRGTLNVVKRLGHAKHPAVRLKVGEDDAKWPLAPFPFTGDLRLFMLDDKGPFCLNWSVKDKYKDFKEKGPRAKPRPLDDLTDPASVARQDLDVAYHSDAEIRTQFASKDRLDTELRLNLRNIFLDDSQEVPLEQSARRDGLEFAREFIGQDIPIHFVARRLAKRFGIEAEEAVALIFQGIWRRELRVDLFRPLLHTKPLRTEVVDVLVKYAPWFSR